MLKYVIYLCGFEISDRWSGSYSNNGFIYEQLLDVELGKTYRLSMLTVNAGYAVRTPENVFLYAFYQDMYMYSNVNLFVLLCC